MSIKHGLLALLDQGPRYGYQLRAEFEARTGSTWPLNVGQVYTTLGRLDRDGLVAPDGEDDEGHVFYRITESGHAELLTWFRSPVSRTNPPRDELAIKLAMAVTVPGIEVGAVVQGQRAHTLRALQDYTRLKTRGAGDDLAWQLVLESLIFHAEAEVRWLDHCEARLARKAAQQQSTPGSDTPASAPVRGRRARR